MDAYDEQAQMMFEEHIIDETQLAAILRDEATLRAQVERLQVQFAGCLTAAEGWDGVCTPDGEGAYGWSPAFERVREIRRALDAARDVGRHFLVLWHIHERHEGPWTACRIEGCSTARRALGEAL